MLGAVEIIRVGGVEAAASDAPMTAQTRAALSSEFLPGYGETSLTTAMSACFSLATEGRDHNERQG